MYVRYQYARGEATLLDLAKVSYWVLQYTFGVIDAERVAASALRSLRGTDEAALAKRCEEWFEEMVRPHVAERGRAAVKKHLAEGDIVAIVTAATPYASRPLAKELGIQHIAASNLELDERNRFTGRLEKPFCYGPGKIARAEALGKELGFSLDEAIFYSDSYTDLPLLERAGDRVCVNPDPRLRRVARARGWRIEKW